MGTQIASYWKPQFFKFYIFLSGLLLIHGKLCYLDSQKQYQSDNDAEKGVIF